MAADVIVVLGPRGQVGSELVDLGPSVEAEVVALDRSVVDLAAPATVAPALADLSPATVINAAAYTAVDRAEAEPGPAYLVNAAGVEALAMACDAIGARLIHLSTDYVFDGTKGDPYEVDDPPNPTGVYGRSKRAGELAALSVPGNVVVRTAWVYSPTGSNFVKTIRRLAVERDRLGVVADQFGSPSAAADVAAAVMAIATAEEPFSGIVHAASPDTATWWDVAQAVVDHLGDRSSAVVAPITTADYPTDATRPADTRLDVSLLETRFGHRLRPWREALREVCRRLDDHELEASMATGPVSKGTP